MKYVRSTKHNLNAANTGKKRILSEFLAAYRIAVRACVDYIWSSELYRDEKLAFSIQKDILNLPFFLDYQLIPNTTQLSSRAFCSALEQAIDMVRSRTEQRRGMLWWKSKLLAEGKDTSIADRKLDRLPLIKPTISDNLGAELSSKCLDFEDDSKHFDLFIRIKATGFDHIKLPVQLHKVDRKFRHSKRLSGINLKENQMILRYQTEVANKVVGKTVGADTGITNTIMLADGQTGGLTDKHGHSLSSIMQTLSRKQKGGKAFARIQAQRENFINWSLNQLNLDGIKQINLEKINTFNGGKKGRFLTHFSHALISDKVIRMSEEHGVRVQLQPSIYKSQRCSDCGIVCKSNRNGKEYRCQNCGLMIDADFNSALNNSIFLPKIPETLAAVKLNVSGFFWKSEGFFDLTGQALGVPDADKKVGN